MLIIKFYNKTTKKIENNIEVVLNEAIKCNFKNKKFPLDMVLKQNKLQLMIMVYFKSKKLKIKIQFTSIVSVINMASK